MSLTGSAVILVVILARQLLKRFPKIFSYALWAVVLFRLLCPVSVSASLSMLDWLRPEITTVSERTSAVSYLPVRYVYTSEKDNLPQPTPPQETDTHPSQEKTSPSVSVMTVAAYLWAAGVCLMVLRSVIQYLGLRRKLVGAIVYRGEVYLADYIDTPFALGILRPRIYLPFQTPKEERRYIIAHERHHIRRGDHVMKLLAYGALCIHWFNPLVWTAFLLAGKDMEMSCDEAVIRKLGEHIRADYSATLLRMATHKHTIAASPLAFGEGDTKGRIQNMAKWKKPKLWVSTLCLILCIAVFAACALNPTEEESTLSEVMSEYPFSLDKLPEEYSVEQDKKGNLLFSDGTNTVGGITRHPPTEDAYLNFGWVNQLDLWEWEDETLGHYASGSSDGIWTLEFFSDVPEGTPKTVNRRHTLFPTETVIYDIWFDGMLLEYETQRQLLEILFNQEPEDQMETTSSTQLLAEETRPTYQSEFTNRDGRVSFHIDATMPREIEEGVILEAVPHYLTVEDVKRAAYAIFGEDAYFTEAPPRFEKYTETREQLEAAIERMKPYTTPEAWEYLMGSKEAADQEREKQILEENASTTSGLLASYQRRLENFRQDFPEEPCKWTWQNDVYYCYAPEHVSESGLAESNDAIQAFVEADGVSYEFNASTRDEENFKINNISAWPNWPAGWFEVDDKLLRRNLCEEEPTQEQIAQACAKAERILKDMQLGQWQISDAYVELNTYTNTDIILYEICIQAVPVLEGGADVRRGQHGNINQASEDPAPDNYYLTRAEFQFAPNGELLEVDILSPMDTTVVSRTNAVYSVADLLDLAEETLKDADINYYGMDVDEMEYEDAKCDVTISEIQTGMARVRVEGTKEMYRYVPALSLIGTCTYTVNGGSPWEPGNGYQVNFLTINAIDGSIIDNPGAPEA